MKDIITKINENKEALSALYLKNEEADTWTISDKGKKIKDIGGIQIGWDPHSGIYFIGETSKLKMLQSAIQEETIIEENI
jgi:hypothetical protein